MIPDGVLSSQVVASNVLPPRDRPKELLIDYDYGPVGISDPSQGLMNKIWTGVYQGGSVVYKCDDLPDTVIYSTPNINELSITFDQNGRPCFGFCDDLGSHIYWFDTLSNQYEVLDVGAQAYNPRVVLDDKRLFNLLNNDILFCYILNNQLCIRYQRERFQTEHVLYTVSSKSRLKNIGMNAGNRIQFMMEEAISV